MPRKSDRLHESQDHKVFIRNPRGKYLAQDANGLFFTEDRTGALVFDYRGDAVAEQLEVISKTYGVVLAADPVPPEEIYETCDQCQDLFMPFMTFFDGKQFLCADCRRRGQGHSAKPRLSPPS
jgi:hypothetical protein